MSTDTINDTDDSTDEACPVCGQSYDHKLEVDGRKPSLRDDATACIQDLTLGIGDVKYRMYVHLHRPQVVRHVDEKPDDESGLEALFS
ncbi:MAG: hypothetical protein ACOCQY_02715 [Halorhabdus sp.]